MPTIFFPGIYGVGKSTLCETLSQHTNIPFYSASDLISRANGEKYGANKAVSDKIKNQDLLITCVDNILKNTTQILLAGHFCILNHQNKVDVLPATVFDNLHISKIILLEADIPIIIDHLKKRDSKAYDTELVKKLQLCERESAYQISEQLGCPLHIHHMCYTDLDVSTVSRLL